MDNTLAKSFIAQPKAMMNAFKNSLSQTPINSTYTSKRTAANHAVRFDNGYAPSPFQSQMQVFATPFATHLRASEVSGNLFGFAAGATLFEGDYIAQASLAYARGKSEQEFDTQSTEVNADLVQVAGFSRLFYGKIEVDLSADLIWGKFSVENSWFDDSTMNFNAKFGNYQANLGAILGYRFGEKFSVKPFAGVQIKAEKQDEFRQNGGLNLQSKAYNGFVFGGVAGLEARYIFENGAFIFAKASYEKFNEPVNENFILKNETLRYKNYDNIANVSVGGRIFSTNSFKIDLQGLYQRYNDGLNALGGNVAFRWHF